MLAGLPKAPNYYSPINNPERALHRRNLVINNMLEDGKITAAEAERAKSAPLGLKLQAEPNDIAPYFVEEIRQYLEKKYGSGAGPRGRPAGVHLARPGFAARRQSAVLRWPGCLRTPARMEGQSAERHRQWRHARPPIDHVDWDGAIAPGSYVHALVTEVEPMAATVKFGNYEARLGPEEIKWTRHTSPQQFLTRRRHRVRQGHRAERHGQPRVARAGVGRARRAAGARQCHRRCKGDGRRARLRASRSSTARRRRCARSARPSSRIFTPPPSIRD